MTKDELIHQAKELGYDIIITIDGDSKRVQFNGTCSKEPAKVSHSYSLEWTDHDIRKDVIYDLLRWGGLVTETRLTHKG